MLFAVIAEWQAGKQDWALPLLGIGMLFSGGFILAAAIDYFRQIPHAREQRIVFISNGVVEYGVRRMFTRTDRVIFYDRVARVRLKTWTSGRRIHQEHLALTIHSYNGSTFDWEIDDRFGSKEEIAEQVIASFAQYQARHSAG
jgi:hypothetical protein